MTTIYLVNEKPDGSGRWRNIGIHRWVESGDFATNFVDRDEALRKASECGGRVVEFTMGGAKPEPREPDAIMVCHEDGEPNWEDVYCDGVPEDVPSYQARKVYLDTPPPTSGREEWSALKALLAKMTAEKDAALAEVSRLSKALVELHRQFIRLAKQKPVAWRRLMHGGPGWIYYSALPSEPNLAAWEHRGCPVEPLYAAPKPAAEPDTDGFNGPLTRKYAAMEDARDLNTCQACNAGPDMIGPVHTCEPAPPQSTEHLYDAVNYTRPPAPADTPIRCPDCGAAHSLQTVDLCPCAPADTPAMVEGRSGAMFAIGDTAWPGISKLVEECGELLQVCGKLMGTRGKTDHWDGSCLRNRLHEEVADLVAAVDFVVDHCKLSTEFIRARRDRKAALFVEWHRADTRALQGRGGK